MPRYEASRFLGVHTSAPQESEAETFRLTFKSFNTQKNPKMSIIISKYDEIYRNYSNISAVLKLFQHLCCFQVISHDATYALLFETRLLPASPCVALCCRSCSVPCTKANFRVSPTPMAKRANDAADSC